MTPKQTQTAKNAAAAAKRSHLKVEALAKVQKDEAAAKLAAEAVVDAAEAAAAAEEVEKETARQEVRIAKLKAEDPTLWEQFKKWFD